MSYNRNVTLYRWFENFLEENGYFSNEEMIENLIEGIEDWNSSEFNAMMTPASWINQLIQNHSDTFIHKATTYDTIIRELNKQRLECIDQTGLNPSIYDYSENMRCDEWKEKFKNVPFDIDIRISEVFNYLLDYYLNKEGTK